MLLEPGQRTIEITNRDYFIVLDSTREVSGKADCNTCGGSYTRGLADSISIRLACTKMGCPSGSYGAQFQEAVMQSSRYRIDANTLRLLGSAGREVILSAR